MAVSQADVIGLYLAYFGRAPDPTGVAFYTSNPSFDIWNVAASFSASAESQALYGSFGYAQINAIYQNLFNRDAEPEGLEFWYTAVVSGRLSPAGAAYHIMQGARNSDVTCIQNKLALCESFMAQLDTPTEIAGYSGDVSAARARAFVRTVDDTAVSKIIANAFLPTQVAFATGATDLEFKATKSATNIVSFSNGGSNIAVTQSGTTYTFTSTNGNTGSATVTGPITGIALLTGTTLTISSTVADGLDFSGPGRALVVASATGEDLSAFDATGVDVIQLTAGKSYTLTPAQVALARFGTVGITGNVTDSGTITVVGDYESVSGAASVALKASGVDVVAWLADASGGITTTNLTGIDRIDLVAGKDYIVHERQVPLIGRADGTQVVTIGSAASSGVTLAAEVETFQLSNFTGNKVVMGATDQIVLGGSSGDTLTAINGVTSTIDLKGGTNIVVVTSGADISRGTFKATGGTVGINLDAATNARMTVDQLSLISSAEETQNITLATAASSLSLRSDIETFTLGNFTNSVTMTDVDQIVIGGTGADTVTTLTGVASSSDLKGGANVVVVTDGANITKGTFSATGGTLTFSLSGASTATMTSAQAALIGTASGTQTVTLSNAASSLTLKSSVENLVLGNFANTVTLTNAAQSVTGGTGVDTINTGSVAAAGTLNAGSGSTDKLTVGGTLGAATITGFEILNITATADVSAANAGAALGAATLLMAASTGLTLTIAQNEGLKASATVAGAGQTVTLADAGVITSIAGIETYRLAAGSNTVATGTAAQTINATALADADVLTLTGSHAATVTLTAGDLAAGAATGNLTVTATTGTNVIETGSGADSVKGGEGDDTITLGTGSDIVIFSSLTGVDTVTDFSAAADKIHLSKAVFTALGSTGTLASTAFEFGSGTTAAATAAGRVVYDTATGDLYYDADGSGATAAVLVGTLSNMPTLAAANFIVIA